MAVLTQPTDNSNPFIDQIGEALAPAGTFIATVIDVRDEFGVVRTKFQSTETEKVDLTTFLFGFRDAQGRPHKVASRRMKISGNEKSALFAFLKALLGRAPEYGWDFCQLKGAKCLLTVEHVKRRDGVGVFASIAALSPVPQGLAIPAAPVAPAPVVVPVPQPPQPIAAPRPVAPAPAAVHSAPSIETFVDDVPF
jgi:hypothetical protein